MENSILIVSPHLDDEVIGCGGAIARHVAAGDVVTVIYLTHGEPFPVRNHEARRAGAILGIKHQVFLRFADRYLEVNQDTLAAITHQLFKFQPNIVYCPHPQEAHPDHVTAYDLTIRSLWLAARPQNGETPLRGAEVLTYEIWTPMSRPAIALDITAVMEKKLEAIYCYASQTIKRSYVDAVEGLNRYRGEMSAAEMCRYAEVFGQVTNAPTRVHSLMEEELVDPELLKTVMGTD